MPAPEKPTRRLANQFPRTSGPPSQSSKFWAKEKDRYLRQLLISDIEDQTGREVIVYFARMNEGIGRADADDLSEIIQGLRARDADLILQTPGGEVDAVEKFVTVLRARLNSYRVIVPSLAKSGGTIIAMSSEKILLGVNSELGPIDPQMYLPKYGSVPCDFIAKDTTQPEIIRQFASSAIERMRALARRFLKEGMLAAKDEETLDAVIEKISSADTYKSHGAVIDHSEAESLGLSVEWVGPETELWRRIWLLYCLYDHDTAAKEFGRIVEGAVNSIARRASN